MVSVDLQPDFNSKPRLRFNKKGIFLASIFLVPLVAAGVYAAFNWTQELWVTDPEGRREWAANAFPFADEKPRDTDYPMPAAEKNRYDILILGVRGKDDPDGGSLTDTIMLFSLNKTTGQSTLVSIPRDLYVRIGQGRYDKINTAYEYLGLKGTEKLVSKVTGVYVDQGIVFDFSSFKKIIDDLGGIDITLAAPFEETTQWGYVFKLPAGPNHLDGETALYYVRSRYSSSDFDRARRQQQVMFAIKDKLLALNFLDDPVKSLGLLTTIKSNIHTDINILDIKNVIQLAQQVDASKVKRHVISTANYLYESRSDSGMYILLPQGDSFEKLHSFFQTIFAPTTAKTQT